MERRADSLRQLQSLSHVLLILVDTTSIRDNGF